jgi:hypothetical protein
MPVQPGRRFEADHNGHGEPIVMDRENDRVVCAASSDELAKRIAAKLEVAPRVVALHLRAENDVHGNPRRCFVVFNDRGEFLEAIAEGYEGEWELRSFYPQVVCVESINVPVAEYRRMLRRSSSERVPGSPLSSNPARVLS